MYHGCCDVFFWFCFLSSQLASTHSHLSHVMQASRYTRHWSKGQHACEPQHEAACMSPPSLSLEVKSFLLWSWKKHVSFGLVHEALPTSNASNPELRLRCGSQWIFFWIDWSWLTPHHTTSIYLQLNTISRCPLTRVKQKCIVYNYNYS